MIVYSQTNQKNDSADNSWDEALPDLPDEILQCRVVPLILCVVFVSLRPLLLPYWHCLPSSIFNWNIILALSHVWLGALPLVPGLIFLFDYH